MLPPVQHDVIAGVVDSCQKLIRITICNIE